jgi:hypothetical protein
MQAFADIAFLVPPLIDEFTLHSHLKQQFKRKAVTYRYVPTEDNRQKVALNLDNTRVISRSNSWITIRTDKILDKHEVYYLEIVLEKLPSRSFFIVSLAEAHSTEYDELDLGWSGPRFYASDCIDLMHDLMTLGIVADCTSGFLEMYFIINGEPKGEITPPHDPRPLPFRFLVSLGETGMTARIVPDAMLTIPKHLWKIK